MLGDSKDDDSISCDGWRTGTESLAIEHSDEAKTVPLGSR